LREELQMLKAITHFEQVPLRLVMKIIERDKSKETSEESREENEQNLSRVTEPQMTRNGGDRE
jgi:hypothetical protein